MDCQPDRTITVRTIMFLGDMSLQEPSSEQFGSISDDLWKDLKWLKCTKQRGHKMTDAAT